jgi:hypothetical protein
LVGRPSQRTLRFGFRFLTRRRGSDLGADA